MQCTDHGVSESDTTEGLPLSRSSRSYLASDDDGCLVIPACFLCDPMDCGSSNQLLCPWDFLGKNTGVRCHFLLQRLTPLCNSNPSSPFQKESFSSVSNVPPAPHWLMIGKSPASKPCPLLIH